MPSVANRQPNQAATPESAISLPTFEDFAEKMKPELETVRKNELTPLLRQLYKEAQRKVKLEKVRERARADQFMFRGAKQRIDAVHKKLGQALKILEEAKQENAEELKAIEEGLAWRMAPFTFDGVIQHLKDGMEVADVSRQTYAEMIHPDLRTVGEKQLAQQTGGLSPGAVGLHNYPASVRSAKIDHWFIGAAADCLDKHQAASGGKIPRYDKIISYLFKVCFGNDRDDENIRAELRRQKKHGRPTLDESYL